MDLTGYTVQVNAATTSRFDPSLLDGVMVLEHPGAFSHSTAEKGLYYSVLNDEKVDEAPTTLKLIPYYAWANRSPAAMQVWIPYSRV